MLAGSPTTEPFTASVPLLVAAAGAGVAWLAVLGAVSLWRRPPRVRATPMGMDLPAESPAVAGLLADDFDLPAETAPAILLDLAARDVVDLEEIRPGQTICRVRRTASTQLTAAEEHVLAAVRAKAIDGIVPADALRTGPKDQSRSWHRRLGRAVVDEAKAAGLTRDRWARGPTGLLLVGAGVVGLLIWIALESGDEITDSEAVTAGVAGAIAIAALTLGSLAVTRWLRSLAQLPTPAGLEAARRAVALEEYLGETATLDDLPPAAVTLRGRHLAYGAAFGLAPMAVALLPMGEEDDRRAWSRFGGRWRRVRVRYPRLLAPGWGMHPALAVLLGIAALAVGVLAVYGIESFRTSLADTGLTAEQADIVRVTAIGLMAPFVIAAVWGAVVLVRAVPDLFRTMSVTGEVVRARRRVASRSQGSTTYRYYLAVDDGSDDTVRAYRVRPEIWSAAAQGSNVKVDVTPRLGYVRSLVPA